ncbi:Cyclic nucleotide-binding protein [Pseudocohnilembus persalinus]|uniref:Cyclic nucleotide-binding protein n=1 Tax=Pseudocohnilembus persalinus TaxID=266149 RepID=A0A0V0QV88_PSEPJ|nr:Cyclic nucleotide-binding protein [Pseudocohnilembus persalinus]|eukprot:KRX06126.1 Cyclic nucleotide-binding protein [Pseudocohnilembus persalinus]
MIAKSKQFEKNTWVYWWGVDPADTWQIYLSSTYWSIQTLTAVGFGDITAHNTTEMIFIIIWTCFGAGFYSYTVGSLATVISRGDTRSQKLSNDKLIMDEFCDYTNLPLYFKSEIRDALKHNKKKSIINLQEKEDFFETIPDHLKYQISENMLSEFKDKIPFLEDKNELFIANFLTFLTPASFKAGEYVYKKGEHANTIYFLIKGRVNYIVGNQGLCFKTLPQKSYFGEIECFRVCLRLFSVQCQTNCDLMCIERDQLNQLLQKYKQIKNQMIMISKEKELKIQENLQKISKFQYVYQTSSFWKQREKLTNREMFKKIQQRKNSQMPVQNSQNQSKIIFREIDESNMSRIKEEDYEDSQISALRLQRMDQSQVNLNKDQQQLQEEVSIDQKSQLIEEQSHFGNLNKEGQLKLDLTN